MKLTIPNAGDLELKTVILDLNGTLTVRGKLVQGVEEQTRLLKEKGLKVVLFSGDTRGTASKVVEKLGIDLVLTPDGKSKQVEAKKLGANTCVAMGNGLIDYHLFKTVRLAIAVLQGEGISTRTALEADIIVPSITDALGLLLDEASLIATIRA